MRPDIFADVRYPGGSILPVDQTDQHLLADAVPNVHHHRTQPGAVITGNFKKNFIRSGIDEFDAGFFERSSGYFEDRKRMCNLKWKGGQRAGVLVMLRSTANHKK